MKEAIERLAASFSNFADELRDALDDLPQHDVAGDGEYRDDEPLARVAKPEGRQYRDNGIRDDQDVTLKSGDLRKVVDAYRKLYRYHREGRIMDQDHRLVLNQAVKAVKHLIRTPQR